MASKVITQDTINAIQADWKTGAFVQRDLAYKYKVSVGVINKHTKGLEKSNENLVNTIVQSEQALGKLDEHSVNAVKEVVDKRVQRLNFLDNAAMKNVSDAMQAKCVDQQDFKHRADTILKARDVIEPKNSVLQVNTQVNNTPLTPDRFEEIAQRLLREV